MEAMVEAMGTVLVDKTQGDKGFVLKSIWYIIHSIIDRKDLSPWT